MAPDWPWAHILDISGTKVARRNLDGPQKAGMVLFWGSKQVRKVMIWIIIYIIIYIYIVGWGLVIFIILLDEVWTVWSSCSGFEKKTVSNQLGNFIDFQLPQIVFFALRCVDPFVEPAFLQGNGSGPESKLATAGEHEHLILFYTDCRKETENWSWL